MAKRVNKKALYARPLPIVLSSERWGPLPELFPHNPVSWMHFGWKWLRIVAQTPPHATVARVAVSYDGVFKVEDEEEMMYLWRNGFFGKGSLSRSEPTWKQRTIDRLGLEGSESTSRLEDITRKRRQERNLFKELRSRLQDLEIRKKAGIITKEETVEMEGLENRVDEMRSGRTKEISKSTENDKGETNDAGNVTKKGDSEISKTSETSETSETNLVGQTSISTVNKESDEAVLSNARDTTEYDLSLYDPETRQLHRNLEFVQLQPVEVFFLAFALGSVQVTVKGREISLLELYRLCCEVQPNFSHRYAVYHHFRSMGWCVRSGIKFGTEYLLYKRGPPFNHAEYAVMCLDADYDWFEMSAIGRVIGTVKKTLVLAYTEQGPSLEEVMSRLYTTDMRVVFSEYFQGFTVSEVLYRRWAPGRTRE